MQTFAGSDSRKLISFDFSGGLNIVGPSRSVAQPGSALAWGARGRRFESSRSDHFFQYYLTKLMMPGLHTSGSAVIPFQNNYAPEKAERQIHMTPVIDVNHPPYK